MAVISVLLLHVEPFLLSWGHQPLIVLYSCSQGFLLHGKSALSSDWVVRGKKEKNSQNQVKYQINIYEKYGNSYPYCPGTWRCASLRYWPGRGLVYVCPLLFFVSRKWVISELRCSRRFQSGAKCEAIKVTRPSYFVRKHPTLKFCGIPTFTLIISLTYSMDNIWSIYNIA